MKQELSSTIQKCKSGNIAAQKSLFMLFFAVGKRICLRYSSNIQEAEEMLNDGFLKVFRNLSLYNSEQSFEAWFKTIITRTCIDYYRKYSSKVTLHSLENHLYLEDSENLIDNLDNNEILELIQKLPPAYRTVFSMYIIDGYSHAEISELLEISEGTSRSNLAKARYKLQEWVQILYSESKSVTEYGEI
ncbi:MAG: RNA polymerase sigma factor [Leadbetterella sp.]